MKTLVVNETKFSIMTKMEEVRAAFGVSTARLQRIVDDMRAEMVLGLGDQVLK